MINDIEMQRLYAEGAIKLEAGALADFGSPAKSMFFLYEPGLPRAPQPEISLVKFVQPERKIVGDAEVVLIGQEPWTDELWLAIRFDGSVVAVRRDSVSPMFVNSDVEKLVEFLAGYQSFQMEAEAVDGGPTIMSRSEMRACLDAMRRGEVRPRRTAVNFNRAAMLSELKRRWATVDAAALKPDSWWSIQLEQLEDGLI